MADYKEVRATSYCEPSDQKRNVDEMNKKMGYNNLGNIANRNMSPTGMKGAKSNPQVGPKLPGSTKY